MNGLGDPEDLPFRFEMLSKTKEPEFRRCWTPRPCGESFDSFGSWQRCCARSSWGCSIRILAGSARTARSGASAGRGAEGTGRFDSAWGGYGVMLYIATMPE